MRRAGVLVLLLAGVLPAAADDAGDMAAAANRFYATRAAQPRSGGLPEGVARGRYLPLLSPRLAGLLNDATAAQVRFHAKVRNAPPLLEGDIFSSQFEGFQTYKVGACTGTAKAGRCSVTLHYDAPALPSGSAKGQADKQPADWTDDILLVKTGTGWKVDDIAYKGAFAFGNTGLLSQTLKMVISTAP